ncbi:hypothetical protein ACIOEX_01760 [Streptomyces sp. NPDC087850]|uniref:hypothetical protein n=1 Tax=Streptomyces sp. NPDC087850 TaxID=3365809 RepID=UPI0037FDDFF4
MPQPYPLAAIPQWLAETLNDPTEARQEWQAGRLAMLPTGILFDAVKMHPTIVHAAVRSSTEATVSTTLAETLDGPVICHYGHWYYALVPPQTTETWMSPHATVKGRGAWVGVPPIEITAREPLHWSVPAVQVGKLCAPGDVAELLRIGAARLEGVLL